MQSCPVLRNRRDLNSGRSDPKLLPTYFIAKPHLLLHPNTNCPFQKPLVTVQPAVRLIATVPIYRIHTFTSRFFPLIGCTSSSLTMQTLVSLQGPFSTRSLTSLSQCALHNLVSVSMLGGRVIFLVLLYN